jgi:UDP-N-acetylglucosamine acyltransferase
MVVPEVPDEPLDDEALESLLWFGGMGVGIEIGDRTIIREMSTVQQGTRRPTRIGAGVFLMDKSHVAHDDHVGDRVTIAPFVGLAGHVTIGDDATVGLNASVHQWRVVGAGAMVGMQSTVTKDVRPFELVKGSPARAGGLNRVRLERLGVPADEAEALAAHYAGDTDAPPARFDAVLGEFRRQLEWRG